MADQNKSKLIIGLLLIAVSFIFVIAVLYSAAQSNQKAAERAASLQVQLSNLVNEKAEGQLSPADSGRVKHKPVDLENFLSHAESIYGPDELNRKEGTLWVDRKSSACVVTLGVVNGMKEGSRLDIYEDGTKMGELIVDVPLDIISYVKPVGKSMDDFAKNYYRVSVPKTP